MCIFDYICIIISRQYMSFLDLQSVHSGVTEYFHVDNHFLSAKLELPDRFRSLSLRKLAAANSSLQKPALRADLFAFRHKNTTVSHNMQSICNVDAAIPAKQPIFER